VSSRIAISPGRVRTRSQKSPNDVQLAILAKALGHPARVAILRFLLRDGACVCGSVVDRLPLAQSTVSQHLKVLKQAGLVMGSVDGPSICYSVDPRALDRLRNLLNELSGTIEGDAS